MTHTMKTTKYATLFGGAMNITDSIEYQETVMIGELLTEKGYTVKNGGYRGMMEAVSKGVYMAKGEVIGYTCATFPSTKGNSYLSKTVVCNDIFDRLRNLIDGSELFIIQRGGVGTVSELFLCLDIIRKMKDNRPRIIAVGYFWKSILKECEYLISDKEIAMIEIVNDFKEFKAKL